MPTLTRSRVLIGAAVIVVVGFMCVLLAAIVVLGVDQNSLTSQVNHLSIELTRQTDNLASTLEPEIAGTMRGDVGAGRAVSGTFEPRTPGARRTPTN